MAITSQLQRQGLGEVEIIDWQSSGLLKPSVIKPVITTIDKNIVLKILGKLSSQDQGRLQESIQLSIG